MKDSDKAREFHGIYESETGWTMKADSAAAAEWFDWVVDPEIDIDQVRRVFQRIMAKVDYAPSLATVRRVYREMSGKGITVAAGHVFHPRPDCDFCGNSGTIWVVCEGQPRQVPCSCHYGLPKNQQCFPEPVTYEDMSRAWAFTRWAWQQPTYRSAEECPGGQQSPTTET